MFKNKTVLIIAGVVVAFIVILYLVRRSNAANSASGLKLYCGGNDSHGHNIYAGQPCQTSNTGSYSVSSGGNGLWAYGNNGCYCNTNAIHVHPIESPNNLGPISQNNLDNIAAGALNVPAGHSVSPVATKGARVVSYPTV